MNTLHKAYELGANATAISKTKNRPNLFWI